MRKLTFNKWGWVVVAIERNSNYTQHLRFDTIEGAQAFLNANPEAWAI